MPNQTDEPTPAVIFRSRSADACRERALVLASMSIAHRVLSQDGEFLLLVPPELGDYAREQVTRYERENRGWPPRLPRVPQRSDGVLGVLAYITVLVVLAMMQGDRALAVDWLSIGRVDGALMRDGQWWRAVTALTLHADVAHLGGNVVFGAVFGLFLGQLLGQGWAWLLVLLGGTTGNVLNVLVQPVSHRAIGASTAVFAALGILTAYVWMHYRDPRFRIVQRIAPIVSGLVLLAYLGVGNERTDIVAHLTGFVCGALLGVLAQRVGERVAGTRAQVLLALAALALLAGAWALGLRDAGVS